MYNSQSTNRHLVRSILYSWEMAAEIQIVSLNSSIHRFKARLMSFHKILIASILGLFIAIGPNRAKADVINFTGVNLSSVSSGAGQNFAYTVDGGATGNLNVRRISGAVGDIITGGGPNPPDPTGLYVLQAQSQIADPITLRFTFDTSRSFEIRNNETPASIERDTFTMPTGAWTVLSSSNVTYTNSGSTVSIAGTLMAPPWGDYSIAGTSLWFDWQITNSPGFEVYGSAISINVTAGNVTAVPEPSSFTLFAVATLVLSLRRRYKVLPRYSPATEPLNH